MAAVSKGGPLITAAQWNENLWLHVLEVQQCLSYREFPLGRQLYCGRKEKPEKNSRQKDFYPVAYGL